MAVEIIPATVRDVTFIAANMRSEDWAEIRCQVPDGTTRLDVALMSLAAGEAWIAWRRGQPAMAFGVSPVTVSVLSIWAWGVPGCHRVAPAVGRFVMGDLAPRWIAEGRTRVEARSIEGHEAAHRWMRACGAREAPCPGWGKGGEDFILFWWTQEEWNDDVG